MAKLGFMFSKTRGSTKKGDMGFGTRGIPHSTAGQGMSEWLLGIRPRNQPAQMELMAGGLWGK